MSDDKVLDQTFAVETGGPDILKPRRERNFDGGDDYFDSAGGNDFSAKTARHRSVFLGLE